jgi:glycerol-3-phosphate cytidylyltransferase-like family protein
LDTRQKIALAGATVVTGHFDPLTAAHTRRLAELKREGRPLVVVITSPSEPILPAAARAELVAALGIVDQVIVADEVLREEQADAARASLLIERVRSRQ